MSGNGWGTMMLELDPLKYATSRTDQYARMLVDAAKGTGDSNYEEAPSEFGDEPSVDSPQQPTAQPTNTNPLDSLGSIFGPGFGTYFSTFFSGISEFLGDEMSGLLQGFMGSDMGFLGTLFGGGGEEQQQPQPTDPAVGPAPAVSALATGGDAKDKAILDMIASVEAAKADPYGGFNTSAGATAGRATEKTIDWLARNANGAIGRYQHMPSFIRDRAIAAGFDRFNQVHSRSSG